MFRINDSIVFQGKEYTISKFLGQGGMGYVFSIEEKNGNSKFALKSLQHFLPDDNNYRSLINEWAQAQKITHENVICYRGFHDGLSEPRTPYLIMDLAEDGSLEDFLLSQNEFMEESVCLEIFHQIIDGMEAVNKFLVHRDIKPDNIFIEKGVFKIADFGLAKIAEEKTRSKTFKGWGTDPYIAPEAYRAETNTIQMDMYSIGHVFYQIAGMRHAYGTPDDWEQAHLTAVPKALNTVNANISPKVSAVINKLMAKRPHARFKTWDEVRQELICASHNVGDHKSAIDNILQKKILRDLKAEETLSAEKSKEKELKRKSDILDFQFKNEIIQPLNEFVDDFNKVSGSGSTMNMNKVSAKGGLDLTSNIRFDQKSVRIWFHKLDDSDVIKRYVGGLRSEHKLLLRKPTLHGRDILAWGGIVSSDKRGLNILLVASENDDYGDWFLLENTHSAFAPPDDNKPEPFAFSSRELVNEIQNIGVMHIYSLNVSPLDIDSIVDFISNAF
ncbi:serine/threonine protein kinase [Pseudoalteromonas luteoviolacea S2607]|uniref:serine/threonine-protein kinase n=1 Tax=Pseudoalteromonas luteoviolacea TaxID=43657 RepID=UPI0007B05E9A|nr:serine/threonine-protein kinase [Pseudoalteromonas luteoviolacea]KZN30057.1 serine/threonine protein kinase [Pseudoalteromonas luteoviolacea S2607]